MDKCGATSNPPPFWTRMDGRFHLTADKICGGGFAIKQNGWNWRQNGNFFYSESVCIIYSQSDHMGTKKVAQDIRTVAHNIRKVSQDTQFLNNKITTKVSKYLRLLLKKNCGQELTKIAQFGHTVFAANPEI